MNLFHDLGLGLQARHLGPDEQADACPEKKLWQVVVVQAVKDAAGHRVVGITGEVSIAEARARARAWILRGDDFEEVCDLAGLDPYWIRRRLRKFLAMGRETQAQDKGTGRSCDQHEHNGTNSAPSLRSIN